MSNRIPSSILRGLPAVALLAFGLAEPASAETPITIVNNLDQPLAFVEISNRAHVQIKTDPPTTILAHSSGTFRIAVGSSPGNDHLNVKYAIESTADQVGIVYKYDKLTGGSKRCPKEHPDWVSETVEHCGDWNSKGWAYTFSPVSE